MTRETRKKERETERQRDRKRDRERENQFKVFLFDLDFTPRGNESLVERKGRQTERQRGIEAEKSEVTGRCEAREAEREAGGGRPERIS